MVFQDYIKTLNIVTVPVLIRANSDISISASHELCVERVERVASENPDLNVWLELTDLRVGNRYTIFSKSMMAKYEINDQVNLDLDMVGIRQAISQSHPDAIRALIDESLASIDESSKAFSAEDVASILKSDDDFIESVVPGIPSQNSVFFTRSQDQKIDLMRLSSDYYYPVVIENGFSNRINRFEISRGHDEYSDGFGLQSTFFQFDFIGFSVSRDTVCLVIKKNHQSYASALALAGVVDCKPVVFLRGGLAYRFSSNSGSGFSVIESHRDYVDEAGESYFIQPLLADFVASHPNFLGVDNVIISSKEHTFDCRNIGSSSGFQ